MTSLATYRVGKGYKEVGTFHRKEEEFTGKSTFL